MSAKLKFGKRQLALPGSPAIRMALGILLVAGGIVGFLPILGFWMVPLGLLVLSVDLPSVRRFRRRMEVKWGRWARKPSVRRFRRRVELKWDSWVRKWRAAKAD